MRVAGNLGANAETTKHSQTQEEHTEAKFPTTTQVRLSEKSPHQKTLSKKRVAPSPSFLLLRKESRPKADLIIALRRGLKGSPRRGKGTGAERTLQAERERSIAHHVAMRIILFL